MKYSLSREMDGAGDSGSVSTLLWAEGEEIKVEHYARPRVGVCIQVGSPFARTMQRQDYWQTSYITEIVKEEENYIKFRTGNSIYEWKQF